MTTKYLSTKHGIEILHSDGTTQILAGADDPSVTGVPAEIGSVYLCSTVSGAFYKKAGSDDTDWIIMATKVYVDAVKYVPLTTSDDFIIPTNTAFLGVDEFTVEGAASLIIEGTGRMMLVG